MDKTFDAAAAEPRIYAEWERADAFAAGANVKPGAESFCIVIPPPNVTGSLHMGHALNNTLQDILIRWHRMRGFDTLWQAGQDHAGIATQMVVERRLAEAGEPGRRELGRDAFVDKVWEWKEQSGDTIINQLKRLGASCDWSRNRFTMDEGFHDAVLRVFVQLYRDGLIYKDKRLVNWDPRFETAISDLEVEQVEEKGHLWRFRYRLADGQTYRWPVAHDEDGKPTEWEERDYIVVATTRPETMLGDTGVAVHPDDARYSGLVGKEVILPMVGRRIPIVADDYADPEKGTGAVKITPAHDFNDFQVGKRHNLRQINVMSTKAEIVLEGNADFIDGCEPTAAAMGLHGLDRFEARKRVVEIARAEGWLDGIEEEVHTVPHGDRSKVPVEPYLTDQWFVDAATLAKPAIEAVRAGRTRFAPENWEKTYFQWLKNIEPWCISRQLWWGHRIPVWYGPRLASDPKFSDPSAGPKHFVAATESEAVHQAGIYYRRPVDVFSAGLASEQFQSAYGHFEWAQRVRCDAQLWEQAKNNDPHAELRDARAPLHRDDDVLDTWFSSGLWPFGTLGWPGDTAELRRYYPTDVLITGFDIIFFWVARMMMMGLHFMKDGEGRPQVPFHTVYVHALVRDEHGKKMSKSLGNVIDPLDLIDEYGADAVRFTLTSMAAMGRDIKLAVSRVEGYRNFATKLWNAARFAEMNECKPVAEFDPASITHPVNRWIVGETVRIARATDEALAAYRFNDAASGLYAHVWGVFCDWYLELAKPLLQGRDEAVQAETRATAAWALDHCLMLLHPIMPFVTEALWGQIARRETMLIHAPWPELSADLVDPQADRDIGWTIRLIEGIRSVRAEMNVPPSAEIEMVLTGHNAEVGQRLLRHAALIRRLARLSEVAVAERAPAGAVTVAMEDCAANLVLKGVIDIEAEKSRLEKALQKTAKETAQLEGKLGNEKFLAKAPEAVVAEQRARLESALAERSKLEAARARLEEIG